MKLTKNDWIHRGVGILSTEGAYALMIDHLCARLRITKGSFYHYFNGIDEYIRLIMKAWENNVNAELKKIDESGKNANERLDMLRTYIFSDTGKSELGVRSMALERKNLRSFVDRVNTSRQRVLARICKEMGLDDKRARAVARLVNDCWVGLLIAGIDDQSARDEALGNLTDLLMKGL